MILKSPYPTVPPLPEGNLHDFCFNRPDHSAWPDFTLYIDAETERETKFSEFKQRIQLGATALGTSTQEGGLELLAGNGELIGIMGLNSVNYITLVHSLVYLATPSALISPYSTPFELNHALTLTKLTRLFVDASLIPLVKPVAEKAGITADKIYILDGTLEGHRSFDGMVRRVQSKGTAITPVRLATKNTLAYLLFSSGTTGLPKAVMLSQGNIKFAMAQVMTVGGYVMKVAPVHCVAEFDFFDLNSIVASKPAAGIAVNLAYLPLYHTYGLHHYSFSPFIAPASFLLMKKWDVEFALKAFRKYKITVAALVPSIAHQLVNHPGINDTHFSSITTFLSGAAYLPPDLARKLKKLIPQTATVSEGYGMTESTVTVISQPPIMLPQAEQIRASGSVGVLLPGVEARLVRDNGTDAGVDEEGDIFLRGSTVTLGYWNNEKATRETFLEDGWLKTGDRMRANKGGHFFFCDRAKDTLKVSGVQVSPAEIEDVLLADPRKLIIDAAVAGVGGGRTSDEKLPRAWVVLSPEGQRLGEQQALKELEAWHKQSLSKYKWLRGGIEVVEQIPKSPTGKVLKRILVDKFEKEDKPISRL